MNRPAAIYPIIIYICTLWVAITGCDTQDRLPDPAARTAHPMMEGRNYASFSRSTSAETNGSLPDGTTLSFFASAGLTTGTGTFTLQDGFWTSASYPEWESGHQAVSIGVLSPSMPSSAAGYYQSDGTLTDVLYDKQTCSSGNRITLRFKHLFAKVEFQLSPTANANVSHIAFTPTQSVKDIVMPEAQIVLSEDNLQTATLDKQADGKYALIVPPSTNMGIDIAIHSTTGETTLAKLGNRTFEQGHEYRCHVKKENVRGDLPGIYTVEDFIAFCHLINNETYQERKLSEFGSMENEIMTYRLKNDLTFGEEESARTVLIGYVNSKGFEGCFDGENHTLSGLILCPQGTLRYPGIFTAIAAGGSVRNLHIENFSYSHTINKDMAAILCGINYGTIHNCHIKNSSISVANSNSNSTKSIGGITVSNQGMLCNSSCTNVTFSGKYDYMGGLAYVNTNGKLVNCYVANCNFSKSKADATIAYQSSSSSQIYNCYSANNTHASTGYLISNASKSTVQNCFYNESIAKSVGTNGSGNSISFKKFETTGASNIPTLLNEWITSQGAALFPEQTFFQWQAAENVPFTFVTD